MEEIDINELDAGFELYYGRNKNILLKNKHLYHPNGKIAWDGLKFITPTEKIVYAHKCLFHLNGNIAWNGNTQIGYDTEGLFLSKGGVGVKVFQGMTVLCNKYWFGVALSYLIDEEDMSHVQIILKRF